MIMAVNKSGPHTKIWGPFVLSKYVGICIKEKIDICRKVLEEKDGRDGLCFYASKVLNNS